MDPCYMLFEETVIHSSASKLPFMPCQKRLFTFPSPGDRHSRRPPVLSAIQPANS